MKKKKIKKIGKRVFNSDGTINVLINCLSQRRYRSFNKVITLT